MLSGDAKTMLDEVLVRCRAERLRPRAPFTPQRDLKSRSVFRSGPSI